MGQWWGIGGGGVSEAVNLDKPNKCKCFQIKKRKQQNQTQNTEDIRTFLKSEEDNNFYESFSSRYRQNLAKKMKGYDFVIIY